MPSTLSNPLLFQNPRLPKSPTVAPPSFFLLFFLLLLPSLGLSISPSSLSSPSSPRIIGGSLVTSSDAHPWIVYLNVTCKGANSHLDCTASLLNNKTILTAAHCLFQIEKVLGNQCTGLPVAIKASVGLDRTNPEELIQGYERIEIHPNFKLIDSGPSEFFSDPNDIALIILKEGFTTRKTFAKLPIYDLEVGTKVTAAGWGLDEMGELQPGLREVELEIQSGLSCKDRKADFSSKMELCVGTSEGGRGTCRGDSGGPLFINDIVYGVNDFGDCTISVFAKVTYHRSWILSVLDKLENDDIIQQTTGESDDDDSSRGSRGIEKVLGWWGVILGVLLWIL